MKSDVCSWALVCLQKCMVETTVSMEMMIDNHLVCNFTDIKRSWARDDSGENAGIVYEICYGYFDDNKGWELQFEKEFMNLMNWQYKKHATIDEGDAVALAEATAATDGTSTAKGELKGCATKLITNMKDDLVKQIQHAGKSAHGKNITISRPATLITKVTKWNKKEWGKFILTLMMKAPNSEQFALPDPDMTGDSDASLATTILCDVESPKHMVLVKKSVLREQKVHIDFDLLLHVLKNGLCCKKGLSICL